MKTIDNKQFDDWMNLIGLSLIGVGAFCLAVCMLLLTIALFGAVFFGWGG